MPYAILRFQKRKAGGVAACERHNERKKEAYKSNPDIDMERSKNNYHLIAPPSTPTRKRLTAWCRSGVQDKERQRDDGGNAHHSFTRIYEPVTARRTKSVFPDGS